MFLMSKDEKIGKINYDPCEKCEHSNGMGVATGEMCWYCEYHNTEKQILKKLAYGNCGQPLDWGE